MFRDRNEAGRELATRIKSYAGQNTIILALPRGGVPVGYEIAKVLLAPLDIYSVRKVGHPLNPEYAVCAVDEMGNKFCNQSETQNIDPIWLNDEIEKQIKEAKRRAELYRNGRPPAEIRSKTVILVDDGAATGLTLRLAIQSLRQKEVKKIIVVVPVAPRETAKILEREADKLIALEIPEFFLGAVGAYYQNFNQVTDKEVISLLQTS